MRRCRNWLSAFRIGDWQIFQAYQASWAQLEPQAGLPRVLRPGAEPAPDRQEAAATAPADPAVPAQMNGSWSMDFMSDALWCGRRFRTFNVADDFNREVLAIEIDLNLPAARVVRVLERIAAWRGYPAQIRMGNGPEFIATSLADREQQHSVVLDFIEPAGRCRTASSNGSAVATGSAGYVCVQNPG